MSRFFLVFICLLITPVTQAQDDADPAEIVIGERLFSDFRFSQLFFEKSQGDANHELDEGDPQLEFLRVLENKSQHQSPFRGQAMSCATCHMVDQANDIFPQGMRLYSDFATFSPIPVRSADPEGSETLRNSQFILPMPPSDTETPEFFHWDGEFNSLEALVAAGLQGRNMGWLITESSDAIANVANIIRSDNGLGSVALDFGGYSYRELLLSEDPLIEESLRLPPELRLDVNNASDEQIVLHVAKLMSIFMRGISLSKDQNGDFSGSPYDVFIAKNNFPKSPAAGESPAEYSQRLLSLIEGSDNLKYVTEADGSFASHDQKFVFGEDELIGLKLFFRVPAQGRHGPAAACVQCHTPPTFTNSGFHNIGLSQLQYEQLHGMETFKNLKIPSLSEREALRDLFGRPTATSPDRQNLLGSKPILADPERADLGLWSLFANSDFPDIQADLKTIIALSLPEFPIAQMSDEEILPLTVGMMKTPSLRNLGHSAPYFHDGHAQNLEMVLAAYISFGMGSRHGTLRPVDPKIKNIHMHGPHARFVVAFLKSLNEDYE